MMAMSACATVDPESGAIIIEYDAATTSPGLPGPDHCHPQRQHRRFTYGKGIVHSQSYNTRQPPLRRAQRYRPPDLSYTYKPEQLSTPREGMKEKASLTNIVLDKNLDELRQTLNQSDGIIGVVSLDTVELQFSDSFPDRSVPSI